jgi:hypothetical protein
MRAYYNKKLIIPSSLQHPPGDPTPPNHSFRKNPPHPSANVSPSTHLPHPNRPIKTASSYNLPCCPSRQLKKWKLEISSKEKNSLVYGKELKIGGKLRKIYISDEELEIMKYHLAVKERKKPQSSHRRPPKTNALMQPLLISHQKYDCQDLAKYNKYRS